MQAEIWHITGGGFHFGRHGLGQEESGAHLPSDTLMAALLARLAERAGAAAVDELAGALRGDPPPFVLSSAFPRAGSVRFFPTPLRPPPTDSGAKPDAPRPKDLKKIKFVSERIFRALLDEQSLVDAVGASRKLHDGALRVSAAEWESLPEKAREEGKLWHIEKRPRVAVGRAAHNSQIYHTGRTAYQSGCGLWFAVRWFERAVEPLFHAVLADLADAGLGGERSSGFGQCQIEKAGTLELPDPGAGKWVALSRYWPGPDEMSALLADDTAYTLESVGGWVYSPADKNQRRRVARLLAEGAVLGAVGRAVPGQMEDVSPRYGESPSLPHPVWRSGRALAVGVK